MEYAGAGTGEAASGRRLVSQAGGSLCAGAAAAFRSGQMVSRRAIATLGADLPLAQGRPTDLAQPAALCAGIEADDRHPRNGAPLRARLRATPAARSRLSVPCLRGHLVLPVARTATAQQRHGRRIEGEGSAGTRAAFPRLREGPRIRRGLRAADRARARQGTERARRTLEERPVVPAFGEMLSHPR